MGKRGRAPGLARLSERLWRLIFAVAAAGALTSSIRAHASVTLTIAPLGGLPTPLTSYIRADLQNCVNPTILNAASAVPPSRRFPLRGLPSVTITVEDNVTQIACNGNQLSYYTFTYVNGPQQIQLKSVELPPGGPFNLANLAPLTSPPFNPGVIQGPPGVPGPVGPSGCTVTPTTPCLPFNVVHWQNYAGLTDDARFETALSAWSPASAPLDFINDTPATFATGHQLPVGARISAHADMYYAAPSSGTIPALFTAFGSNSLGCWPGVNLSGPSSKASGVVFFTASSGANYDVGQNCTIHDMERFALFPKSVNNIAVHDVTEAYNLYSLAFIGQQATTTGPAADQPTGIRFFRNYVHDSTLGLDDYYSHDVEAFGNRFIKLDLYGLTGAGGNAASYADPNGSMTNVNYHDNTCDTVHACEFVVMTIGAHLGHGSVSRDADDYGFGVEGGWQTTIDGPTCTGSGARSTNGCAATEFKAKQVLITHVNSTFGGVLLKNAGQSSGDVSDYQIKDSTVPSMLLEPFQNLEISGVHVNGGSIVTVLRHDGLYIHDDWIWKIYGTGAVSTDLCAICGASTSGGTIDRYDRNMVNAIGTVPSTARAFELTESNFNFSANTQMTDNTTSGFPTFLRYDSIGGNGGIYPTAHLHFNHRRGAVLQNVNTNGRGTISEDSTYDANEQLHIIGAQTTPVN